MSCLQNADEVTIAYRAGETSCLQMWRSQSHVDWETSCLQMRHVDWEVSCFANAAFGLRHRLFVNVTCGLRETKCWNANKIWKVGFRLKSYGFQLGQQFKKLLTDFEMHIMNILWNAHHWINFPNFCNWALMCLSACSASIPLRWQVMLRNLDIKEVQISSIQHYAQCC